MRSSHFSGKKILVTGASGFIGSHLCNNLLKHGAEIHGVSRRIDPGGKPIVWWQGDLTDLEFVKSIFKYVKPDFVFHLASHVSGSRDLNVVIPTFQSNLITTVNLLITATTYGCQRIILAGSMEEPEPSDEAIPCSPYAASKWAGNGYARMFHSLYSTPVVIARIFMVYGPGQQDLKKLIPYIILSFLNNHVPELSSGTREIDWIYVEDVIDGFIALSSVPGIDGKTIDVGSGSLVSIRKIVETLQNIIKSEIKPSFGSLPDRPMEQVRVADISHTFLQTGWKPVILLEDGLNRTVEWYRSQNISQSTETRNEK